ncbi:hypothetical protein TRFO_23684 [Tritrichomonas foetus]|uniref:PA14 domain-containing protein n=1 Tax=Tritrichomonas foetus TaxID=1144522 RepID=A0A1J4KED4_9EUKA|nr:hypothetical protein TRFO_23684 [Tritrichomonas foetus]|eukprot:OHT07982.1 hypothetical protein TRFO_23684 [Tritrichomonas foetus]
MFSFLFAFSLEYSTYRSLLNDDCVQQLRSGTYNSHTDTGVYSSIDLTFAKQSSTGFGGAFCPWTDGDYTFKASYCQKGGFTVAGVSAGKTPGSSSDCEICSMTGRNSASATISGMKGHKCYEYTVFASKGCYGGELKFTASTGGDERTITSDLTYNCSSTDCVPGYYGENCENKNDVYCGANQISDGLSGDDTCICTNGKERPFCEDLNEIPESHIDPIIIWTAIDGSKETKTTTNQWIINANDNEDTNYPYNALTITGDIIIPQNGYYDFKIESYPGAALLLNGVQIGTKSNDYTCDEKRGALSEEFGKTYLTRGNYPFTLSLGTGCSLFRPYVHLFWKFYRLYDNSDDTPWETLPRRYIIA